MPQRGRETAISHDSETSRLRVPEGWKARSDESQSLVSGADGDTLGEDHPQYLVGSSRGWRISPDEMGRTCNQVAAAKRGIVESEGGAIGYSDRTLPKSPNRCG